MSQRSHIASSGSTAICACSAACSEPSSASSGSPAETTASGSSYQSACVENDVWGRSSATRSSTSWSASRRVWYATTCSVTTTEPNESRHAEPLAPVVEPLDVHVGLALGLRVPVALERPHERAARLQVERLDLERAPAVQVHGALVRRAERAPAVDGPEQLARGELDDREAVAARRAQRDRAGRVLAGVARDIRAARPPPQRARRLEPLRRDAAATARTTPSSSGAIGPSCAAQSTCAAWICSFSGSRIAASTGRSRNSSGWRQKNWSSASSPAT